MITKVCEVLSYISAISEAPKEINTAKDEISSLLTTFQGVRRMIEDSGESAVHLAHLAEPNGPFNSVMRIIEDLLELLGGDLADKKPRGEFRIMMMKFKKLTLDDALWRRTARKIATLLTKLEGYKNTITLAMTVAITYVLKLIAHHKVVTH